MNMYIYTYYVYIYIYIYIYIYMYISTFIYTSHVTAMQGGAAAAGAAVRGGDRVRGYAATSAQVPSCPRRH